MKIGLIVLVLFIAFCNAFSYWNMRCPSQSEWGVISSWVCNGIETKKYTCLYNAIRREYEESCKFQPVISGNGSQYVISVYPNSEPCRNYDRYQPFPLGSNAGSDCVFQKSTCSEEGNILFHHGSPKTDLSCRCNFQKGFGFVNEIPNRCDCIPSQEDCSCYLKQCPPEHRLLSDYACLHEEERKHIVKCPEMGPENSRKMTTHLRQLSSKELKNIEFLNRRIDFIGLTCLTGICIVYAIVASLLIIINRMPKMFYIDICPFNLEITPDGSSLRISWSISDKVPTIDILGYYIYYTYNGQWKQLEVRKPSKQYSYYKPKPSKTYRFKVSTWLRNKVESKCTEEKTFNTELPIKPKVGIPKGENSKIVLTWNSPRNTLIQIEGYEIQWSIDEWLTIADRKNVAFNVFRHEIETATEGVTYRVEICSFSNSVKSLYEAFQPFATRHDVFTMEVTYDTNDQKDKALVQNNVSERFKDNCIGIPGDQKKIHQSESEGSVIVTIMFISERFTDEKVLHDTFRNTFQKKMIGSDTIKFKSFWLKRMNDPSPPQLVKASRVDNGILVSWKEPFITFFKTIEYVVEYMEDDWTSPQSIVVPADKNSCFITKVLPSANIQIKVYTCICHLIRSCPSSVDSVYVKGKVRHEMMTFTKLLAERIKDKSYENKRQEDEWNDSIWLFKVLDDVGANSENRQICQEEAIFSEIIVTLSTGFDFYRVGSTCEGTALPGAKFNQDAIQCADTWEVIEDISKAETFQLSLLVVRDSETPAGYVKLQLVFSNVQCKTQHLSILRTLCPNIQRYFKFDRFERLVLFDIVDEKVDIYPTNKPAVTTIGHYLNADQCYRCKTWPKVANEWLYRDRFNGWPSQKTIDVLKSLGYFVVKRSHHFSEEKHLEWRITFFLQERQLIFNLTDVQYKCYVILKMLNRDVLHIDCITSYHWKTCLFYVIEENEAIVWERKFLFHCVRLCIKRMLMWVVHGYCPNYFIHKENMFEGKMTDSLGLFLGKKLEELLKVGFNCLLQVHSNNVSDFVRSRNISKWNEELRIKAKKIYKYNLYMNKIYTCHYVMACSGIILGHHQYHKKITNFIEFLWHTLFTIEHADTISEHTQQDTRRALSLLKPLIYTGLASNISAMCIRQPNSHVRDFLLCGCYTFFIKGDLTGRLKFISVLYAIGCYKDCKWFLDNEDEENVKCNPSVCVCHNIQSLHYPFDTTTVEMSKLKQSTCVIFLPTELPITPDALRIEMFRYIGISSHKININDSWAVVDSNVYYFFLKYLINRKIKGSELSVDVLLDIQQMAELMNNSDIKHHDVYYNIMSWCFRDVGFPIIALDISRMSWNIQRPLYPITLFPAKKMTQNQYQFNSAKIHSLVVLYNIWFTRKPPGNQFCFHCFQIGKTNLKKCSGCKTAQYCSKQCQIQNLVIHQTVCKIVKTFHHV